MESSLVHTIAHDAAITAVAFLGTSILYGVTKQYLKSTVVDWHNVKPGVQNRMACEIALLPTRAILFLLCAPAIMSAFAAPDLWTHLDTYRTILASAVMGGSYMFDLTIERNDLLSLIHHFMGPALLLWIRCSYSAFNSSDALMCRMLVSFVFFGAGVGGSVTTCMLVLMKLAKRQIQKSTLYRLVAILSWVLTINTWFSTMYGCTYLLWAFDDLHHHWGHYAGLIPLFLCGFEFWLQWRWALRFQGIAENLGISAGHLMPSKMRVSWDSLGNISKAKIGAGSLALSWAVTYSSVCWKVFHRLALQSV